MQKMWEKKTTPAPPVNVINKVVFDIPKPFGGRLPNYVRLPEETPMNDALRQPPMVEEIVKVLVDELYTKLSRSRA